MQQLEIFLFVIWFIFHLYREYKKCPSSGLKTQALNLKNHTYKHQHISIGDTHTHTHTHTRLFFHSYVAPIMHFYVIYPSFDLCLVFLVNCQHSFSFMRLSLYCSLYSVPFSIFYCKSFWNGNHAVTLL